MRLRRDPELRARVQRRLDANPVWRRVRGPLGFAWDRLMPGRLGLELTTLLALASVGFFTYFWLASLLGTSQIARLDDEAFAIADALYVPVADDILSVLTHLGSLPVTLTAVLLTAGWAICTRSATREGVALIAAYAVTYAVVHIGKAATDRPRPSDPHAIGRGDVRIPRATAPTPSRWWRARSCSPAAATTSPRASRSSPSRSRSRVGVAASRVYLRVHYLSDVIGGLAIGTAIFSLAGIVALAVGALRNNGGR